MDATLGREADLVALVNGLADAPYRYDFYQTLRLFECLCREQPRWGTALRPRDEAIRLGQAADVSFAPAPVASFDPGQGGAPPRLYLNFAGLMGANGPLPLHITEYARERLRHAGDATLSRFLDLLHHRFITFLYRAWAQAQPHVNHDRPGSDRFVAYVGAFFGLAPAAFRSRDSLPDTARFFNVGVLARQVRNADGLEAILRQFFAVPVAVEEFVGHWLRLDESERTRLGRASGALGAQAVLGACVWDRQHKFRIHLGPLTLAQYESFLPGRKNVTNLVDWVRTYLCFELAWDVRLVLERGEIPALALGRGSRLGWTSWLGARPHTCHAGDLCLDAERLAAGGEVGAA